jgi:hypothetical protein
MQNKQWDKKGILFTLKYLKDTEPKCYSCDHCYFYMNENQCSIQQEKIKKEHKNWEQKIQKWKERLNNAK